MEHPLNERIVFLLFLKTAVTQGEGGRPPHVRYAFAPRSSPILLLPAKSLNKVD